MSTSNGTAPSAPEIGQASAIAAAPTTWQPTPPAEERPARQILLSKEQVGFWEAAEPLWLNEQRRDGAPAEIDALLVMLEVPPEVAVLDLCCGPGRHTIELARRGYRMTGLDMTRAYLETADQAATAEGFDIEFIEGDMRLFERPAAFDLIINLGRSFGYFSDPEDDAGVVRSAYRSLRPGGAFVVETIGKEALIRSFRARSWRERQGHFYLFELTPNPTWSWIVDRTIVFDADGGQTELLFSYRPYAASELVSLFEAAGFVDVQAYGDFVGTPYSFTSKQLVVVGRKGGVD
jgi:SAM-dependent methyltransferase